MTNPKKWTEVYPYGTKEGDEEAKFFKELARNPKYEFRSVNHLIKSTGLSRDRVEEIISKYAEEIQPPLLYPHPTKDDEWGYWVRCPDQVKTDNRGISRKDKDQRIDKQLGGSCGSTPSMTENIGVQADGNNYVVTPGVLDEIDDVAYFRNKLFAPMSFPDRWSVSTTDFEQQKIEIKYQQPCGMFQFPEEAMAQFCG